MTDYSDEIFVEKWHSVQAISRTGVASTDLRFSGKLSQLSRVIQKIFDERFPGQGFLESTVMGVEITDPAVIAALEEKLAKQGGHRRDAKGNDLGKVEPKTGEADVQS